jgi:hypothetical protein
VRFRRHKYNARKVEQDGYSFDSQAEARYYQQLKLRQKVGEIDSLAVHPTIKVQNGGVKICNVILDFYFWDRRTNKNCYVDVKGVDTAVSRLKRKLVKAFYNIDVEVVRK